MFAAVAVVADPTVSVVKLEASISSDVVDTVNGIVGAEASITDVVNKSVNNIDVCCDTDLNLVLDSGLFNIDSVSNEILDDDSGSA